MSYNTRIRKAMKALRREQPSGADVDRATKFFAEGLVKKRRWTPVWASGICLMAVSAIAFLMLSPREANAVDSMRQAMESVRAIHIRHYSGDKVTYENWQEGVKRRYWFVGTIDRGYDGEHVWAIHYGNKFNVSGEPDPNGYATLSMEEPYGFGQDGFDVKDQLKNLTPEFVKDKPKVTRSNRTIDGKRVEIVTIEGEWARHSGKFRHVYYCRQADLPYKVEYFTLGAKSNGRPVVALIEYPDDIPDEVFAFKLPKNMPFYDLAVASRQIKDGVAGKGPKARADDVEITFLGAFRESIDRMDPSVYVLWTGGATPHCDAKAAIIDESGKARRVEIMLEEDDRSRPRNHGKVAPGAPNPKPSRLGLDRPYRIRPLGWVDGKPIYAIRWSGFSLDQLKGDRIKVVLPICKEGEMRTVKPYPKGMMFESNGRQIGSATFDVNVLPVVYMHQIMKPIDKNKLNSWGSAPIQIAEK